jgi:RNA polymerase sigma factor (sigma-70 family)
LENFDADYLARLRARDPRTQDHFYGFFKTPIRNYIKHRVRWEDTDDLVQDVFAAALEQIDTGQPEVPEKLDCYIMGICRNKVFRYWRPNFEDQVDPADQAFVDLVESIEGRLIKKAIQDAEHAKIQRVLARLVARYREVITRVYLWEQDRETVAREMGETRRNICLILCRALQRFKKEWDIAQ